MKLLRKIGWIVSLASIVFIVYKIIQYRVDFSLLLNTSSFAFLTLGLVSQILSLVILARSYYYLLRLFQPVPGSTISFFNFYARTNLAKYLPGNVMHVVSRNVSAEEVGGSQKPVLMSSVLEIALILLAAFFLIIFIRPVQLSTITDWVRPMHVVTFFILCVLLCLFTFSKFKIIKYWTQRKWNREFILKISGLTVSYMLVLALQALIPVLIAFYVIKLPLNILSATDIVNAFLVSWTVGFIAIGAPGGIGVREVVFCSILQDLPEDGVVLISVTHRIIGMVGDVIFFLLILLLGQLQKSKT